MTKKEAPKKFKFEPKKIPTNSGCYLYYDAEDNLLYVGKAKNLRKRVSQYFQKTKQTVKTSLMVSKITRIETQVVNSEIEALILENNLIKEYKPKFNILLRDDKNFTYLRVTNETEPKLEIVRRVIKDGSTYFGPKTSGKEFKETVKFCQKFFGAKMVKPNQDYYINQLIGKELPLEEYQANMQRMKAFLRGQTKEVIAELTERMMAFAKESNFEAAARMRDTIQSIDKSTQKQTVEFTDLIDRDFINYHQDGKDIFCVRMAFRQGKFRDLNHIKFKGAEFNEPSEILTQMLMQFYEKVTDYPREIFVPEALENHQILEQFLTDNFFENQKTEICTPQKGDKKKILELAAKNAKNEAEKTKIEEMSQAENFSKALPELTKALNLKEPPKRMECYDISHFSGTHTVASMVVFINGQPKTSEYRRFNIKSLPNGKINDFASMEEVLSRRFQRTESGLTQVRTREVVMKPVETKKEWTEYHRIRKSELFDRYQPEVQYDPEQKDEFKNKNHPMVFYLGNQIIGTVRLDEKPKKQLIMRLMAIDEPLQRQNYGSQALKLIETWALEQKYKHLVLNAQPAVIDFYLKNGFEADYWKGDAHSDCGCVPMGKELLVKKEKWSLPDLVVIDGGKGQLSSTMKVFKDLKVEGFDPQNQIISLAKRDEQIFRPSSREPIELDFDNPGLKLLQRIRDEAHRFAISANRNLRQKSQTKSVLDEVPGIGPGSKKKLMKEFETVGGIREASDQDLLKIINKKQLDNLRKHL